MVEESKPNLAPVYTSDHLVSDTEIAPVEDKVEEQARTSDEDDNEVFESASEDEEETSALRRTDRKRKQPDRFSDYQLYGAFALNAESYIRNLPDTIDETKKRDDWPEWQLAIKDEFKSLDKNHTWDLVDLSDGCRAVPCKWVFKIKYTTTTRHGC